MSMEKSIKKRNWSCILYPESMVDEWKELVLSSGIPFAMSPVHDSDYNADGEPKKPHYHVLFCYSGPNTYNQAEKFSKLLGGTAPQPVESIRGVYRYFTHADNPEKAQYDASDILCLNGFSILDYVEYTKTEVLRTVKELQRMILEQGFVEYSDFMDFVLLNGSDLEYDVASGHTIFFNSYLMSRRYCRSEAE